MCIRDSRYTAAAGSGQAGNGTDKRSAESGQAGNGTGKGTVGGSAEAKRGGRKGKRSDTQRNGTPGDGKILFFPAGRRTRGYADQRQQRGGG